MKMNKTESQKALCQLGLPPMELAESNTNDKNISDLKKCVSPMIQRTIATLVLISLIVASYVILINQLQKLDDIRTVEIIVVTGSRDRLNLTTEQEDIEVYAHVKNKTSQSSEPIRIKREIENDGHTEKSNTAELGLNENVVENSRNIVIDRSKPCNEQNKNQICKDLVKQIAAVSNEKELDLNAQITNSIPKKDVKDEESDVTNKKEFGTKTISVPRTLRSAPSLSTQARDSHIYGEENALPFGHLPYSQVVAPPPLTDTCLLARLLKENHAHVHGLVDVPAAPYLPQHYDGYPLPYSNARYNSASYLKMRDDDLPKRKLHPQDIEIFTKFLSARPSTHSTNSSTREAECESGTLPCNSGDSCVAESKWCDGRVDCNDSSDESTCSCRSRVDKFRLCDGYFDCPFGEDEMGCYGCSESTFSCEDLDINSQSTCFTKEQRCNNIVECPNHKDEIDCTMLAPSLHKKPLFAISNTEGFLQRNFKGDWYAVCQNPYMWAHDACRRETGLIIRPPFIQLIPIDPLQKVSFLNTEPGGILHKSNSCFNSSAVYVTCPDLLCGTRVLSTSQLLKENVAIENHMFGRNKRYLFRNYPYPLFFYSNRKKRSTRTGIGQTNDHIQEPANIDGKSKSFDVIRNKRKESRVVGGKPSQPAAWPWMIAMYRDGMFHCGGVVLTQSWVVSAAHCVNKFWEHYYEIKVGMLRRFSFSPQEQNHQVTHVIVNQNYDQEDMKNDLSLLRVSPAIQFSRWVRPICLPGPGTAGSDWLWGPSAGTRCMAVGWGATTEHGPDPDHMREVEVPIWESCNHREDRAGKEICAGLVEGGKDACQGDSGGPLLCKNPLNPQQWYMAGIVSHGDGCGRKDEPGVYTRVSIFVKWIKYHISSKILPTIQPKQECPGFKCTSGISKCLPSQRMCDKIVDCLGGEDEIHCESVRSNHNLVDLFLKTPSPDTLSRLVAKDIFTKEAEEGHTDGANQINTVTDNLPTNSTLDVLPSGSGSMITATDNIIITTSRENWNNLDKTFSKDTNETKQTNREAHDDMVTVSLPKETLESMSSIKDDKKSRETDIHEDWSTSTEVLTPSLPSKNIETENSDITPENENTSTEMQKEMVEPETNQQHTNLPLEENDKNKNILLKPNADDENENLNHDSKHLETTEQSSSNENIQSRPNKNKINQNVKTEINENLDSNEDVKFKPNKDLKIDQESKELDTGSGINFNKNMNLVPNKDLEDKNVSSEPKHLDTDLPLDSEENANFENTSETKIIKEKEFIDNIRDMAVFKYKPAKIRKLHKNPNEFECRRIFQMIPYSLRCDRKADCEDGTDELSCSCIDYISQSDEKLICNGQFDCADGLDEMDCFDCPENHFLCKRSQLCLPSELVCDGKAQCPQGEDELNCYALTNGRNMILDIDDRPRITLEGFLTRKHRNHWHIICDDNFSRDQQEHAADHICRYLGFNSANRYFVKHVNVKQDEILDSTEDLRTRRNAHHQEVPVHFAYRKVDDKGETRNVMIKEPEILKEKCVPNVTKTCMSLYVFCDPSLFTNEILFSREVVNANQEVHTWPWVAKVYADGLYKCSGVLIDLSWALVSHSCLWDTLLSHSFVTVALGSHKTLDTTNGVYEQIYQVDSKKDSHYGKTTLLHLISPAEYSAMVKPMVIHSTHTHDEKPSICVAIGQDENNSTVGIFLEESNDNCDLNSRCFVRLQNDNICAPDMVSRRHWAGIISCHADRGWYPAASFVDSRGECGMGDRITATPIHGLKKEMMKFHQGRSNSNSIEEGEGGICEGARCSRGRCVDLSQVCDGIGDCEDLNDESDVACETKARLCSKEPYHRGCECSSGQMKCHNGKCVAKELFRDGRNDCGDDTDEPTQTSCAHYLAKVKPGRLCDGILHCKDRSDEDPTFCKCFAKGTYKCKSSNDVDYCVAPDMMCDGVKDCPNGDDEAVCIALRSPEGSPHGTGQVVFRSHGVWHSKCYPKENHTRSELEAICREVGFISGHAKKIQTPSQSFVPLHENAVQINPFHEIVLNNYTTVHIRNSNEPIAKPIVAETLQNCFPVFIECL